MDLGMDPRIIKQSTGTVVVIGDTIDFVFV